MDKPQPYRIPNEIVRQITSKDSSVALFPKSGKGIVDLSVEGGFSIPELASDPVSPEDGDAWVLRSSSAVGGGAALGLLLTLTSPGSVSTTYDFSYKTISDGIKRVELT